MTKPAVTLELGTGLLVARVQDTFGGGGADSGLYFAPGAIFADSIDLMTRYNPQIAQKITSDFYSPSFLKPRVAQRCTTHVSKMKMISDAELPYRNPVILKYATIPGSHNANVFAATPEEQRKKDKMQVSNINSTGRGAMKQEILCKAACGTFNTAATEHFHPKDFEILKAAREKLQTKTSLKTGLKTELKHEQFNSSLPPPLLPSIPTPRLGGAPSPATARTAPTTMARPSTSSSSVTAVAQATATRWPATTTSADTTVSSTVKSVVNTGESAMGESETILSAAAITGFKGGGSRARRATKGARSGLQDHRKQQPDTNVWKHLLEQRRGYLFAARVLARILAWSRRHKKQKADGDDSTETTEQRAVKELFRGERENAFEAAGKRRAGGSSSTFQIVEHEGIIMLQGRKYDPGTEGNPSIIRQTDHVVVPEAQRAAYSVPLLSPTSALGRSTAQEVHDMCHSESAASTNARGSRWFYWLPSAMPYLKHLRDSCYTCRKLLQKKGKDII